VAAGTYTITLTITDADLEQNVETKVDYITVVADSVPDATFTGNVTIIVAGQSVLFTHSGGHGNAPDTYQWYFGDLTANATTEDVTHQFTTAGTYTVTLTMVDVDNDENVHQHVNYIVVGVDVLPVATFTANDTTLIAGQSAAFTHTGAHGNLTETYQWYFDDGTANATIENPVHAFNIPGVFTITLTIVDLDFDQDVVVMAAYITVVANTWPDASFTANVTTIIAGQSILFNHTGMHGNLPETYQWYFGDLSANETTENVTHQFVDHDDHRRRGSRRECRTEG
jgi:PKD repeat protein